MSFDLKYVRVNTDCLFLKGERINVRVIFSKRAYTAILAETLSKINTETGGVFLGKYINGDWYVVESIDPGPNSVFEVDYFEYDQPYVQHLINKKALLYSEKLELIGLWHRHPGTFDVFSKTDGIANSTYAAMRDEGTVSMLVNLEPEFRFTIYHVAQPCTYTKIDEYEVGDSLFPKGLLEYENINLLKAKLNGREEIESLEQNKEDNSEENLSEILKIILPILRKQYRYEKKFDFWGLIKNQSNNKGIAEIVAEDILFFTDKYQMKFYSTLLSDKLIIAQGSGNEKEELIFSYNEREELYLLKYGKETFYYTEGLLKRLLEEELRNGI